VEAGAPPGRSSDNGFAIVALVLGVASLAPFYGIAAAPFAILFGVLGRRRARAGGPHGSLASAGFLLGALGAAEQIVFMLFLFAG
jgi:hypothetical protein